MEIRAVRAELFHAEGRTERRTDMTKQTVAFCNITNASVLVILPGCQFPVKV